MSTLICISFVIRFSKVLTREEVLGTPFKGGVLPQGLQLEDEVPTLAGWGGCWWKRAGYFYYIGWQRGSSQ